MKKMIKHRFSLLVFVIGSFILTQLYQNCAPLPMGEMSSSSSKDPAGHDTGTGNGFHPIDESQKTLPTQQHLVANKNYVAAIFKDVFGSSTTYPIPDLDAYIEKWVTFKGMQFGGSCNYYSTYSGKDCAGSSSNANISHYTPDNTVRESFRLQVCQNLLGDVVGLNAALERAGLNSNSPINSSTLTAVYGLFYRNDPPSNEVLATLLDLDKSLADSKAVLRERWRAILSQVCESPGWQLL